MSNIAFGSKSQNLYMMLIAVVPEIRALPSMSVPEAFEFVYRLPSCTLLDIVGDDQDSFPAIVNAVRNFVVDAQMGLLVPFARVKGVSFPERPVHLCRSGFARAVAAFVGQTPIPCCQSTSDFSAEERAAYAVMVDAFCANPAEAHFFEHLRTDPECIALFYAYLQSITTTQKRHGDGDDRPQKKRE